MGRHRERHQLALGRARAPLVAALLALAAALGLAALQAGDAREGEDPAAAGRVAAQGGDHGAPDSLGPLGGAGDAGGSRRESGLPLVEEGEGILEGYRRRGDCVVARAGYLDLSGRVWGCVVQGAGWVEVSVVREGDEGGSEVFSWRMDADDVGP